MTHKFKVLNLILLVAIAMNIGIYYLMRKGQNLIFDLEKIVPKTNEMWSSKELPISDYIREGVKADSAISRSYFDGNGNMVEVWMAFYKDQLRSTAHNPNTCLDGAGWSTEKYKDFIILQDGTTLKMAKIYLTKGNENRVVYYWYMAAGQIADTELKQNVFKFYYGLLKNRRDLLFLRFSVDGSSNVRYSLPGRGDKRLYQVLLPIVEKSVTELLF